MWILIVVILVTIAVAIYEHDAIFALFKKKEVITTVCPDCNKPVEPVCPDCGKPTVIIPTIKTPITAKIVLRADNGTDTNIISGSICTRSQGLIAEETLTNCDCPDCLTREWYDNGVLIPEATGLKELKQSMHDFHPAGKKLMYQLKDGNTVLASATAEVL